MAFLAQIINWLNVPTNAAGKFLLAPLMTLDGWLSNVIVAAVAGLVLMIIFKYTSNQRAIGRVRDDIKANMLALKLYKDSIAVTLQSQGRVFGDAFLLLFHSLRPMAAMIVPVCLLLAQLGLWYQVQPLKQGQEAIVVMQLKGDAESDWPDVRLENTAAAEIVVEQSSVFSKRQIWWKIKAVKDGYSNIVFDVDGQKVDKAIAVGDGFMRVSSCRPGFKPAEILIHPAEKPFKANSVVESITIDYPKRDFGISGSDKWLIYFFVASMVFALVFKPFLKVRI